MAEHTNGVEEKKEIEIVTATQKDLEITDYIRESLEKVAYAENFHNFELLFDHGSNIGDGFIGIMLKVVIKEHDSDKSLQVLAKVPPANKARRDMMKSMKLFEREVFIYNEVLPEFVALQKEKKIPYNNGFYNFPKVYFAEYNEEKDDSIIIMEDLRDSGFRMWDKTKPVNFEHTKLLMVAMGRYHGLSFALRKHKPEIFETYKALNDYMSENMMEEQMLVFLNQGLQKSLELLPESDIKSRTKFEKFSKEIVQFMRNATNPDVIEPFGVVGHGDCWVNNFIFHYANRSLPDKIVLLDWQVARYATPVLDLVHFIFSSTDKKLRDEHFDELISIYHHSLKELLDHLGGDTISQFPYTALLRQLKRFGKFGVMMATFIVPALQTKGEDMPDMDFMAEKMKDMDMETMTAIMDKLRAKNGPIDERMRDVIYDGIKYGYL